MNQVNAFVDEFEYLNPQPLDVKRSVPAQYPRFSLS